MDENNRFTLLICTVGGTPEPVAKSLLHWDPDRVLFLPSEQTRPHVDAVLRAFAEAAGRPLSPGQYRVNPVPDPEDLIASVRTIHAFDSEVAEWLARDGGDYRVIVDFTAATKCMTAALALVSRRWRCWYSYVGGQRRTKGGVGVVETGAERVVHSANPWDALGYQAVEEAVAIFDNGGYAAAAHLLEDAKKNAEKPEVKRVLATLQTVVEAYAAWDRFDHKDACAKLDNALKNRNDLAAILPAASNLATQLERDRRYVAELCATNEPSTAWVKDLLGNAQRRFGEGRFDDAVARYYRTIEAIAQMRLAEKHSIPSTSQVPLGSLPEPLASEWKCRARDGTVFLGLQDAYELLRALGDELVAKFDQSHLHDRTKSPLVSRNQSILAHGFEPVEEKICRKLQSAAMELAGLQEADLPRFPSIGSRPCGAGEAFSR